MKQQTYQEKLLREQLSVDYSAKSVNSKLSKPNRTTERKSKAMRMASRQLALPEPRFDEISFQPERTQPTYREPYDDDKLKLIDDEELIINRANLMTPQGHNKVNFEPSTRKTRPEYYATLPLVDHSQMIQSEYQSPPKTDPNEDFRTQAILDIVNKVAQITSRMGQVETSLMT